MRAVVITKPGGPEVLALLDRPEPRPGRGEVLIRVRASALNRADVLQRQGHYPAPPGAVADVSGLECAGTIAGFGEGVTSRRIGERVMAIVSGGAHADFVLVPERAVIRIPSGMSFDHAAAIPEAFMTAWDAAVLQGGLRAGQRLAVTAVGSGVGTAAIQIARACGAESLGSARNPTKIVRSRALGLTWGGADLREVARGAGVTADVLLDLVGGRGLTTALEVLRPQGSAVLIGLVGGGRAELSLGPILARRLHLVGTVLRSRPNEEKVALAQAFEREVIPLFERGLLKPVVDRVLPLEAVAEGHRALEANETFGKIVFHHGI